MICRRAAELIGESLDTPLSFLQRYALGVHTLFCGPCRRFRDQLKRMDSACQQGVSNDSPATGQLSIEARARISAALEQSQNG